MQQTYRCHLTVIASWQGYKAKTVSRHPHVCCILKKEVRQPGPLYLIWHIQRPSCDFLFFPYCTITITVELNVLGLRPPTFNCQLENVKSQKGYSFNLINELQRCQFFLLKDVTITTVTTASVTNVTITTVTIWVFSSFVILFFLV